MKRWSVALLTVALALPGLAQAMPKPVFGPATTKTNISRHLRQVVKGANTNAPMPTLPANAGQYRYVLVKGLFGNNYPFYMAKTEKALRDQGLSVEFAPINTAASVADNSAVIEQMIRTTDRPIVFVGHSKGVADATDAIGRLATSDPGLVRSQVRGFVSLHGAYGGSPIADAIASTKVGRFAMKVMAKVVKGDAQAGYDLQTRARLAATTDHPMPTDVVPTVSLVGYHLTYRSPMALGLLFLKKKFGLLSDGLVAHRHAVIDGSDVARVHVDHARGAFGDLSHRMTLALVGHVLRMPYEP